MFYMQIGVRNKKAALLRRLNSRHLVDNMSHAGMRRFRRYTQTRRVVKADTVSVSWVNPVSFWVLQSIMNSVFFPLISPVKIKSS